MLPSVQLIPLPYYPDSAVWFLPLRQLPHPVWLDSAYPGSQYGRFDILTAAPAVTFSTRGQMTLILSGDEKSVANANPFHLLQSYLNVRTHPVAQVPFCGGLLGYFSYDLGRQLEQLPHLARQDIRLPDMSVGLYPWAIVQDHQQRCAWLVVNEALAPTYNFLEIRDLCAQTGLEHRFHDFTLNLEKIKKSFKINQFHAELHVDEYARAISKIQSYIAAGDCYQVNFAQRFSASCEGDSLLAYLRMREALPSPFSAYMELPEGAVLSLSPERFVQVRQGMAETRPIKGTIARGATPAQDEYNACQLVDSPKDRAENLMIVDLLRNDLSKTCDSVTVPALFELQSFANVHHLVSTITGRLKPGKTALDLLETCFPGGSITGAPKIRAMEIIEELEPVRRSLYCGSIGYISSCGNMDTNIAIRTLLRDGDQMHCWGGGGIVADSLMDREYSESLAKVTLLMNTLEDHFGPRDN